MLHMKTITEIRNSFWESHPEFKAHFRKTYRHNKYNATIRSCFVAYVDGLERDNQITSALANRATL